MSKEAAVEDEQPKKKRKSRKGFGSIEKLKSGRYRAYWRKGSIKVLADETFPNRQLASDWLAAQQVAIAKGLIDPELAEEELSPVKADVPTFKEWKETYLARREKEGGMKPKTIQSYKSCFKAHLEDTFGDKLINLITNQQVKDWYNGFDGKKLGARKSTYRVFSALMNAAVDEGLIDASPVHVKGAVSKKPTTDNHRNIVATCDQVSRLAEAMPDEYRIAVLLAFWCSLRFGEITELRRKDVRFKGEKAVISVTRAVQYAAGFGYTVGPPKSEAGIRDIAVPPTIVAVLKEHIAKYVAPDKESLLVHSPVSLVKWYSNKSMNGHFAKAKRAVPDLDQRFTFHGLRHSGLTLAGQSGATLAELMHRAGHANAETVMIYQHATQDRDAAIAEKMSAISN